MTASFVITHHRLVIYMSPVTLRDTEGGDEKMVPHNISCHTFRYIWFCNGKQPPDSILCHYAPPQPPGGDTVTERLVFKQSIGPVCHNQASTQDHSEHQPGPILYLITSSHTHTHTETDTHRVHMCSITLANTYMWKCIHGQGTRITQYKFCFLNSASW